MDALHNNNCVYTVAQIVLCNPSPLAMRQGQCKTWLSASNFWWAQGSSTQKLTVAEKDTAAAAKATVSRPKATVGRQRAAHRLRLAAAAQPRPPIFLKIDSLAYNWLTRLLSRTHAQAVGLSVCLCHRPHDMHRHLGTVGYNGDQIQQRNGLGLVRIRSILVTGAIKHTCWSRLSTARFLPMRTQY